MSAPFGYYDVSYPPELWESAPAAPPVVGAARRSASEGDGTAETVSRVLTVSAGTPGGYEPEVAAVDRPRNLDELREQTRLDDPAPWPVGSFVPVGVKGKRAHWTGDDWAGGISPGYAAPVAPEVTETAEAVDEQ